MVQALNDRIAHLKKKQGELAARLNTLQVKAKDKDRQLDTRRKIIVGGAILAAIEKDPALGLSVGKILTASVGRAIDREAIADLIKPPNG